MLLPYGEGGAGRPGGVPKLQYKPNILNNPKRKTNYAPINNQSYDPMQAYLDAVEGKRQEQIAKARSIIEQQVNMAVGNIQNQISKVPEAYQPMKNQSELNRFKSKISMRENQANRGALDSGAGRQEALALNNNYGNSLNQINLAEQEEIAGYNQQMEDIRNQGNIQMSQVDLDSMGDLSSYLSQIDPSQFVNKSRTTANNVVARTAANLPTKSIEEAAYKPNNQYDDYIGLFNNKGPINQAQIMVNQLLKSGKITREDADRMLNR